MTEPRRWRWPPLPRDLADRAGADAGEVTAAFHALATYLAEGRWPAVPEGTAEGARLLATVQRLGAAELALLARSASGRRLRAIVAAEALLRAVLGPMTATADEPETEVSPGSEAGGAGAPRVALGPAFSAMDAVGGLADEVRRLAPWASWHTRGSAIEDALVDRLEELAALIERVPELRAIADRLGRLAASERASRGVERGGRQTVVGVTVGGELADVLPCELALLADSATEDLFYARLTERRLLSFELTGDGGEAPVRARRPGAVIACVDTSGSMRGGPEAVAKAAILAVARRVLGAGRRMTVLLFGGRGAVTEVSLSPSRLDLGALLSLLMTSYYGGTDFDGPLERALDLRLTASGMRDADLLLVTDGLFQLGAAARAKLDAARARDDLEVVTAVIGGYTDRVAPFSDHVWPIDDETLSGAGLSAYR